MVAQLTLLLYVIVGAIAGWITGQYLQGNGFGLVGDILVGIVGAFIGGYVFGKAGVDLGGSVVGAVVVAFIGALVLLLMTRIVMNKGSKSRWS